MNSKNFIRESELFSNYPKVDSDINTRIDQIAQLLKGSGKDVNPFILEYLKDSDLFNALPEEIKSSDEELLKILDNSGRFQDIITKEREKAWGGDMSGLLGEKIKIPKTEHADGRVRRDESGYKINIEYLKTIGINPAKVLFFRVTQPSEQPKAEYYWTSDYFETQRGLTVEITYEQRKTAIILVADLETINKNNGLIQDINDDEGLPVRQIGTGGFDQKLAIAKIEINPK